MTGFRRGTRIGIDVGKARVGVARCDPDGMLAVPVETVPRSETSIDRILQLIAEWEPLEIVVGLPVNMRGEETLSTDDARAFAEELQRHSGLDIRMVDERLSTVSAHTALRASGRTQKNSRSIVDQVAAVVLLQHAVDTEKSTGMPAGALITPAQEPPRDV